MFLTSRLRSNTPPKTNIEPKKLVVCVDVSPFVTRGGGSILRFHLFLCRRSIWVFPKIGGKPPKWMVKIMENPYYLKDDDLGGKLPLFSETPIYSMIF